jgi:DNA-3-methyladenine glycosylase I
LNYSSNAIPGGTDEKSRYMKRCDWAKTALEIEYHDKEWGIPVQDDQKMFEFLVLEFFQAGLSWNTILKKRENFREAFDGFNYEKMADYKDSKVKILLNNKGIIRNKKKIQAAIHNAQKYMAIQSKFGSFCDYIWSFVNYRPITNAWESIEEVPAKTELSDAISKDMKRRGFVFFGSTICYAHMQATGMVNDHLTGCFRYDPIRQITGENF